MKYKQIFKSWWFYALVGFTSIWQILSQQRYYGNLFMAQYIGIIMGSFIATLIIVSLGWIGYKIFSKVFDKLTKR